MTLTTLVSTLGTGVGVGDGVGDGVGVGSGVGVGVGSGVGGGVGSGVGGGVGSGVGVTTDVGVVQSASELPMPFEPSCGQPPLSAEMPVGLIATIAATRTIITAARVGSAF